MGLVGIVQNDIKRVVAYSTLSQLGYMTVALGASAYSVAIFHLATHAFFKALLFLAAGSVIIALHHEQDMRRMGGLKRYMPITYVTAVIGSMALAGIPPFAGFFSKDAILEAVHASQLPAAGLVYWTVLAGVFVTALYSFRLIFIAFHGKPRMDEHTLSHVRESPWVVWMPLVLLAVPSVIAGMLFFEPVLLDDYFGASLFAAPQHDPVPHMVQGLRAHTGVDLLWQFTLHAFHGPAIYLAFAGIFVAWLMYRKRPELPAAFAQRFRAIYTALVNKYWFDEVNQAVFAGGARRLGGVFWRLGDVRIIDGLAVNGTARLVGAVAGVVRHLQSGYVYHYAFVMIIGLFLLITYFLGT
jgi:NADH-quinone oxidoreductase subunit L